MPKKEEKNFQFPEILDTLFFFFGIQVNGVNDRAINVKITIRRRIPITIGHDVNCDDHATGARTMWGNRVIVRERQREKQRERREWLEHKDPPICCSILDVGSNRSSPRTDERKRHEAVVAGVHGRCDRGQINPSSGGGASVGRRGSW